MTSSDNNRPGNNLPDPNHPDYQRARVAMAGHMFAIGRSEPASGYGRMADDLMCGDLMEVPTWLALGMIAATTDQSAEIARLRAALEPFAEACTITNKDDDETIDDSIAAGKITFGHLRTARTALNTKDAHR